MEVKVSRRKEEEEEEEEEALIREIKEDLNIEILALKRMSSHIHDYGSFKINLIAYLCKYISGAVNFMEHRNFKLLSFDELLDYNFQLKKVLNKWSRTELFD